VRTRYRITLEVADKPGVLAAIATLFAEHGVSVEAVQQDARKDGPSPTATLVIGTHQATESALAATVAALGATDVVHAVASVLRVEGL
jgi:homoserine dehydrogenase